MSSYQIHSLWRVWNLLFTWKIIQFCKLNIVTLKSWFMINEEFCLVNLRKMNHFLIRSLATIFVYWKYANYSLWQQWKQIDVNLFMHNMKYFTKLLIPNGNEMIPLTSGHHASYLYWLIAVDCTACLKVWDFFKLTKGNH